MSDARIVVSPESLAGLGHGQLAFVKAVKSEDIKALFPDAPPLAPGQNFWALLDASGTPLMVSDSREAVVMNAHEHDLEAVSLH
ncbi:DUF1150 domain-containing protein [Kaistia dalseonensis]|uniref:DUF1150 domain-containing protein n=1 Tax=Kaistia dalseonensis TaxID=410840 RepID=A0ABU0H5K0_9HYPH|nr:DUF1150 domain-containing protein [Kaistia dalseonensis]MCX5495000.1 DUF1150 domain-containing protein [Kaistia dalseonensis]MDQ0437581.1 hypothetical protein [Kaistia dalseonensis]